MNEVVIFEDNAQQAEGRLEGEMQKQRVIRKFWIAHQERRRHRKTCAIKQRMVQQLLTDRVRFA